MKESTDTSAALQCPTAPIPDLIRWRSDFPILDRRVHGKPLVYLDNAATSQKPRCVIDSEARYYAGYNANIHRGIHALSQEATDAYEAARDEGAAAEAKDVNFVACFVIESETDVGVE